MEQTTVATTLAQRLVEAGVHACFAVPGDFNLTLLDGLLAHPDLRLITCCNELNAGYAADGYARSRGLAALAVTFSVGGLSAVNAVAGAFAEDLPLLVISGGPNTAALKAGRTLHHTLAQPEEGERFVQAIYREITAGTFLVRDLGAAAPRIDQALQTALATRKPVYLEIACDLATAPLPRPRPLDLVLPPPAGPAALAAAATETAARLDAARQPVLVAGGRLRSAGGLGAFRRLAERCGYAVACMPDAKGFFPEDHPQFIGLYWGTASSAGCREVVESSDAYIFAGPRFNDYSTVGYSTLLRQDRLVEAHPGRVCAQGQAFHGVDLPGFLEALADRLRPNPEALEAFRRAQGPCAEPPEDGDPGAPLTTRALFRRIQACLEPGDTVVAETGDAWFNGMDLRLPDGCRFEIQMQYGAIGWSVGALLGLGAADRSRRVVGLVGDGSLQMAAQELSTFLREGLRGLVFVFNNGSYAIEAMIHDGPYNALQPWSYVGLAEALRGDAKLLARRVATAGELDEALAEARDFPGLALVEAVLDPRDCNKALLGWGTAVSAFNARRA